MTAPLTPRNNQPPEEPQRPFAPPAHPSPAHASHRPAADGGGTGGSAHAPGEGHPHGHGSGDGPENARELRESVVIALLVTVSGALLGVLWAWLAPHVPLISDSKSVYLQNTEGEEAIGADAVFLLLAIGFGLLSTGVVFLFRRRGGIPLVVALTIGGVLGAVLAWQLGMTLGPTQDVVARAKEVGPGVPFDSPLRLQAMGVLLAWPITSMATQLLLTLLFAPHDPEPAGPVVPDWSGYHQQNPPKPE
ncbi:DUF2567 domain-containing protein [Streptomyces halobius]|uniref:DUF2567 domain-containing protein n=1 Tax=Streptomyces halobius TaxID=2879846 RepID=A0ABY4ME15_9ACTN|nr:DUF2567 domain-containing protein [Streptomyces halobius]UQA96020.1 DUF2567 domain-containing protein [Streptomyces halobius]